MHIGLVGLGKMGNNMRDRLRKAGVEVTGYDPNPAVTDVKTMADLAKALPTPRVVWIMVPSGKVTDEVIADLAKVLEEGDLVIDGGNSKFTDDAVHAEFLSKMKIKFMDCGVSGGVWGLENGYGLMCGGDAADVKRAMPVFDALRPKGPRDEGFVHVGEVGSGHYAKMVHNGIEYAIMQAWGEGYELLELAARHDPGCDGHVQGLAARDRRAVLAARAAGARARGGSEIRRNRGICRRLGRRPMDGPGGAQQRGTGADHQRSNFRAVRVAAG